MKTILSRDSLETALTQRYATKRFDSSKVIPKDTWATLESSLVNTPSSYGIQPWKFIAVTQEGIKRTPDDSILASKNNYSLFVTISPKLLKLAILSFLLLEPICHIKTLIVL